LEAEWEAERAHFENRKSIPEKYEAEQGHEKKWLRATCEKNEDVNGNKKESSEETEEEPAQRPAKTKRESRRIAQRGKKILPQPGGARK
jgi:hypothetical protein